MTELTLDDALAALEVTGPSRDEVDAICQGMFGSPIHYEERREVVRAIVTVARRNGGVVDPNVVRREIPPHVFPRLVGAVYRVMALRGLLEPAGWTVSDDAKGRNAGRPARVWRWVW